MEKASIDEYIAPFPEEVQQIMNKIRALVKDAVPDALEKISYGMPAFYNKNGDLIWFAVWKRHFSLYPIGPEDEAFQDELSGYKGTKGSVHFPLDQPIPYELIRKMVLFREQENRKRAKSAR